MSRLLEILQKIKAKPGMYIGRASVSDLFLFLVGYKTALIELKIESTEEEMDFYREFQPWLQQKYHVSTSNSWAKIIMLYCVNEKEGFESFFKLLDEFLARDKNVNTALHPINSIALASTDEISKLTQEDAV
ncbi:hypothetical protein [Tolypothrix sp. VBCCA 56010]|uniref:hypothetical protein n=1 Tax=Tolypothrix sp. VBCCA 56010 TaxID=3137731 RepID=UPI003D7E4C36